MSARAYGSEDARVARAVPLFQKPLISTEPVVPAFPFDNIRILKQSDEDNQKDREELDKAIKHIINEFSLPTTFSYRDGSKKHSENEVFFHTKLSQINQVVQQYFKDNSNLSVQTQIVKKQDVSLLPKKPSQGRRGDRSNQRST